MYYWQGSESDGSVTEYDPDNGNMLLFPNPPIDLLFDDTTINHVRDVWTRTLGNDVNLDNFLIFDDREGEVEEDDDG
jgi:Rab proteins geranylgeranyltransferase component A